MSILPHMLSDEPLNAPPVSPSQKMIAAFLAIVPGGIVLCLSTYAESIWDFLKRLIVLAVAPAIMLHRTASVVGKVHYDCYVSDGIHRLRRSDNRKSQRHRLC